MTHTPDGDPALIRIGQAMADSFTTSIRMNISHAFQMALRYMDLAAPTLTHQTKEIENEQHEQ